LRKPYLVILGTAAAVPTRTSFAPSIALVGLRSTVLMDVGEGTQIRLQEAGISLCKVELIAITHLHGDHFLGLFPLLQSLNLQCGTSARVRILSPSKALCEILEQSPCVRECIVVSHGTSVSLPDLSITSVRIDHGGIEAYGYHVTVSVDSRARKVVRVFYSGDGVCRDECLSLVRGLGADVVVHDASFTSVDRDKALASAHATALDAALLARSVGAKLLVLTHISARYSDRMSVLSDAKRFFERCVIASDLMAVPLTLY